MNWLKALIFLNVVICVCQSYKILGVFQIPGRSHYILASKLFKEIANRGHDVTFITPFVGKFTNNIQCLLLINSHVSSYDAIPQVPNAIDIGGFHIEEPKKLPDHLQIFLNESTNGVIIFSMGSVLQSADLPEFKRNALLKTFAKLKENVLWKWEDDKLPGQPKNLKIMKWIPTSDILAHPNVKAFISHGGLLSTMESMYHAVPMVGIPVFGDQKMNMANAEAKGYAVVVPYRNITEENLSEALQEILNNPKYKINMKNRSKTMRDRPLKPLESALYWIEYVIRHQGARHLRYPGMDLTWCQRCLVDVVAFVVAVTLISILVVIKTFELMLNGKYKNIDKAKKYK